MLDAYVDSRYRIIFEGRDITTRVARAIVSRIPGKTIYGRVVTYDNPPRLDKKRRYVVTHTRTGNVKWEPAIPETEGGAK